ncbi:hypothetical protein INT47_002246 [Mucor saturninus]|uniref:Uncharacterized protein n=1 Tax=Mucor saturninus TaxID=64648 RepID=A0A8H7R7C1_9FUNG|nr:hypothetical protein INT47_002246 [Mucor saturninus]
MHLSSFLLALTLTACLQLVFAAPLVTETRYVLAKRQCPPGTAPAPPPPPPPPAAPVYTAAECYQATHDVACYQAPPPPPPAPAPASNGPPKADSLKLPDLTCYPLPAAALPGYPVLPAVPPPVLPAVPAAPIPAAPVIPSPTLPTMPTLPGVPEASLPDLSSVALPVLPELPGLPALPGLGR